MSDHMPTGNPGSREGVRRWRRVLRAATLLSLGSALVLLLPAFGCGGSGETNQGGGSGGSAASNGSGGAGADAGTGIGSGGSAANGSGGSGGSAASNGSGGAGASGNLSAATKYWVDASRTSNGDGSEQNPWKAWGNINWTEVSSRLNSNNVVIYFSSRDTWSYYGPFIVGTSGNATYLLTLDGKSEYNLIDSGAASWQAEANSNNRATFTNSNGKGGNIKFNNSTSYVTITGFNVYHPTWGGFNLGTTNPTTDIHHITINNSIVDTPENNHGIWFGYAESGCSDIIISNNTVENTKLEGIYMGHYNYFGSIPGVIIENNTLIDTGLSGEGDIDIKPAVDGAIIRYNKNYRTSGTTSGSVSGVVVAANNAQVYGNEFYNMDQKDNGSDWGFGIYLHADGDGGGSRGQTITSALIYNNLIYNNDRAGIKITANINGYNISGVKIHNNTIIGNGTNGIQATASGGATITIEDMKSNIIYSNKEYEVYLNGSVTLLSADYNHYYRSSGSSWYYKGSKKTWTEWQALGYDVNGLDQYP